MADPITWGLINLVKKGVKGVQTTLDGVSDKVSGLPDLLDADFTEVKNAVAGVKTDTGTNLPQQFDSGVTQVRNDIAGLKLSINDVNSDLNSNFPDNIRKHKVTTIGTAPVGAQSNLVLCDITGSGKVYYAFSSFQAGDHIGTVGMELKITLDDMVINFETSSSNNYDCSLGYISEESVVSKSDSSTDYFYLESLKASWDGGTYDRININSRTDLVTLYESQEPINVTDTVFKTLYGIPFNEKLKVELTTTIKSSSYPNRMGFVSGIQYYVN